jgi:HAD superfamily hydrolase (TIGR01509 family)
MSARPEIQAVLFDLDGTIVDTELAAARVIREMFESWGLVIDPKDAEFLTGRTWASAFDLMFSKYEIPVPRPEGEKTMLDRYAAELKRELPVVKGSVSAVRALSETFPLALVSGSHRREILFALSTLGILECFRFVLGAEDYPRSKPAPDGYLKAMGTLTVDARSTLIFEDSEPGIESALAAGAKVVAITGTNHFLQNTGRAHHHIADLSGVDAEWVRSLWKRLVK